MNHIILILFKTSFLRNKYESCHVRWSYQILYLSFLGLQCNEYLKWFNLVLQFKTNQIWVWHYSSELRHYVSILSIGPWLSQKSFVFIKFKLDFFWSNNALVFSSFLDAPLFIRQFVITNKLTIAVILNYLLKKKYLKKCNLLSIML